MRVEGSGVGTMVEDFPVTDGLAGVEDVKGAYIAAEAIATRLEAITSRLEAVAHRLEMVGSHY